MAVQQAGAGGRPRTFDEEEVLEAALELFWRQGFQRTTTRDLERTLGLSQSSLYNAFGSKYELFEAALDRYEQKTTTLLLEPLGEAEDGLAAADRFFVDLATWVTNEGRRGCMLINMMAEDGGLSPEIRERTQRYRRRVRDGLWGALRRAALRGEVAGDGLETKADLLLGLVLGLNIAARGGASRGEQQRLVQSARDQIEGWRLV